MKDKRKFVRIWNVLDKCPVSFQELQILGSLEYRSANKKGAKGYNRKQLEKRCKCNCYEPLKHLLKLGLISKIGNLYYYTLQPVEWRANGFWKWYLPNEHAEAKHNLTSYDWRLYCLLLTFAKWKMNRDLRHGETCRFIKSISLVAKYCRMCRWQVYESTRKLKEARLVAKDEREWGVVRNIFLCS